MFKFLWFQVQFPLKYSLLLLFNFTLVLVPGPLLAQLVLVGMTTSTCGMVFRHPYCKLRRHHPHQGGTARARVHIASYEGTTPTKVAQHVLGSILQVMKAPPPPRWHSTCLGPYCKLRRHHHHQGGTARARVHIASYEGTTTTTKVAQHILGSILQVTKAPPPPSRWHNTCLGPYCKLRRHHHHQGCTARAWVHIASYEGTTTTKVAQHVLGSILQVTKAPPPPPRWHNTYLGPYCKLRRHHHHHQGGTTHARVHIASYEGTTTTKVAQHVLGSILQVMMAPPPPRWYSTCLGPYCKLRRHHHHQGGTACAREFWSLFWC